MMSQYDTEKFCQPPDPDLICCICQCVLLSPVECPCRHVFCNVCITTWLINHHNCPTCRRRVRQIQLKPVLPMVQNMINRLLMFCDFRDNGCAEKVMLELYLGHVEKCGYRKIKCCFSRCGQMILLKDKEQHENKDCDFREKLCTGRCGLMIPVCMFDSHDCCEELRRFNREKSEMVTELKQKVKELNDMTKKLQKEVDRLREQLQRRRWPMPFGDSWDSDSMYNFLTGSSYSDDDQDSDTSSRDFRSSRDNNNPPPPTSTENDALVQFVVYSRPSTPPVSQTSWPTYQTRSTNYGYDILPPTPPRHSNSTSGPNQALDLSYPAPPVNTLISLPGISEENNNNRQSNVYAWGIPTTNYQPRGTNLPINDGRQENEQINTESHAESYNNEPNGVVNLNTSIPVVNMEEVIHDRNHHSIDETSRHSDHTVYSLSDSDSERRHSRWWRSNWSSVSHLSEHQSDNENRSRSSRSRSNSRESYRSIVRQGRYLRFYSHTSRSRSRSVYSDISGNRSHSYDSYRRSRSYNSYRSRSGSSDYVRSRSRSYDYSRSRSRSYDSRSRSRSYYGRSRSRSYDYGRSGSRSSNTERSTSSSRSSISLRSNSRSLSRSRSRSSNNSTRSRSLSSVYSDVSGSLSTVCSNRNSRSRSRSTTPHSNWSETPTHSRSDIRTSNSSLSPSRSPEKTCFSSSMVNQENNVKGEIAGTSVLPNIGTDIDSTETDSDAGYDFKRRKSKVDNSSNNSDSGIGTELSPTNGDQMNVQNKTEDKSLNSGVQRKRKNSGSDYDRESKRVCVGENLEHCDNTDSNASWVPTDHENEENDTISDEASSESSYEVCVPKTIMEHIDEYDSNETDDTWSPN